jgi:two-component system nitrate/nitrite response regulator NarL
MSSVAVLVGSEVMQRGLHSILEQTSTVHRIQICRTVAELHDSDVIILSAMDPGCQRHLISLGNSTEVKVLVLLGPTDLLRQARHPRADGFLLAHEVTPESLGRALQLLIEGDVPMPGELARLLLDQMTDQVPAATRRPPLTPREQDALRLLIDGLSNKQMGHRLGISEHGVKRLVTSLLTKLDAPNRASAVASALRFGLVPDAT